MAELGEWVLHEEHLLAKPPGRTQLRQVVPVFLSVSWTVFAWAIQHHVRADLRGWSLPGIQASSLQLLLLLVASAVPPTISVSTGWCSGEGRALALFLQGLAVLSATVSLPRRVVRLCVPPEDQPRSRVPKAGVAAIASRLRCGLLAAAAFLVLRPVNVAAEGPVRLAGHRAEAPEVVLDGLLLVAGTLAAWWAGRDCRHSTLGARMQMYSGLFHVVVALATCWSLTAILTLCVSSRRENAVLAEMLKVVEAAFAVAWVASVLSPARNPLVQLALTQSRALSDFEQDDLLAPGWRGWRGLLRVTVAVLNLWEPVWEAVNEQPSRGAHPPTYEGMLRRDTSCVQAVGNMEIAMPVAGGAHRVHSDVDEEAEIQACGYEVVRGRNAWREWVTTSGVHPLWLGAEDAGASPDVAPPSSLTRREEHMKDRGNLELRSTWHFVLVDLFSNRVCSKPLSVVVVVTLAVRVVASDTALYLSQHFENPIISLAVQVICLAILWLLTGLALLGNNPFVNSRIGLLWAILLAALLLVLGCNDAYKFFEDPYGHGIESVAEVQHRVDCLSLSFLANAGLFMIARLVLQRTSWDDYHASELKALWYTADLLRAHGSVSDLRALPPVPGEQLVMKGRHEQDIQVSVQRAPGDGTCDIQLADGRGFGEVRYKHLLRVTPEERVAAESKDQKLKRLKQIFSAAEEYPAALYFGATATVPVLFHLACGCLQAVKGFVHRVYQVHVIAAVLNFYMWAEVVGPPGGQRGDPTAMAERVEAWRMAGGTGFATPDRLERDGVPELFYRWGDGGEQDERFPCSELGLGGKVLALIAGGAAPRFQLHDLPGMVAEAAGSWGLPDDHREEFHQVLDRFWTQRVLDGTANTDVMLDAKRINSLLCEAGLLLNQPVPKLHDVVPGLAHLARDLLGVARGSLLDGLRLLKNQTQEAGAPRIVQHAVRGAGVALIKELEAAVNNATDTLEEHPEDLKQTLQAQHWEEYSKARAKTLAEDALKKQVKELQPAITGRLEGIAETQTAKALAKGKADLAAKVNDTLATLERDSREQLGGEATDAIEALLKRFKQELQERLQADVKRLVLRYGKQAEDALEALTRSRVTPEGADTPRPEADNASSWRREEQERQLLASTATNRPEVDELDTHPSEDAGNATSTTASPALRSILRGLGSGDSPLVDVLLSVVGLLQQDWISWALVGIKLGVRVSLVVAIGFELYVMARTFRKYRQLFESMQAGQHDYLGHESQESLQGGFAETTMFPGVFLGTSVIGLCLVAFVTFITIVVLVLLALPMCAMQWLAPYWPILQYLLWAVLLKKFVQLVVMDWLLVDTGNIVYPGIFSLFWFIQLFLNFVIGLSTAVFRGVTAIAVAALSCNFLDVCLLPELLVSLDTGYYSLLAMAYTHHERRNPVKMATVTVLNGWVHRANGPRKQKAQQSSVVHEGGDSQSGVGLTRELQRVRARFHLFLTLHRNPELKRHRRHNKDRVQPVSGVASRLLGEGSSLFHLSREREARDGVH